MGIICERLWSLSRASKVSSAKNLPTNARAGFALRSGRSPEEGIETYHILAGKISEEPGGLQLIRSQRLRHDLGTEQTTLISCL